MTMTPSIEEKTVMVIVSGHSRKILVVVEIGLGDDTNRVFRDHEGQS